MLRNLILIVLLIISSDTLTAQFVGLPKSPAYGFEINTFFLEKEYVVKSSKTDIIISKYRNMEMTFENIAFAIRELEIRYPVECFKQSVKESGLDYSGMMYASVLSLRYNNLFGMKKSKKRKTHATGTYKSYAKFEHWIYSIMDYKLWQDAAPPKSKENFSQYMSRRKYANDSKSYGKKVKAIKLPTPIQKILEGK